MGFPNVVSLKLNGLEICKNATKVSWAQISEASIKYCICGNKYFLVSGNLPYWMMKL